MSTWLAAILLPATMLLAGCGTLSNRTDPASVGTAGTPPAGKAVVIVSTGGGHACSAREGSHYLGMYDAAVVPSDHNAVENVLIDNHYVKSDFADHPGNLHAVVLPPGRYALVLSKDYLPVGAFGTYVGGGTTHGLRYELSVAAGEVVYAGEYWMGDDHCANTPALPRAPQFRDQQARDMALLAKKNPALARANIVKRLPQ